MINLTDNTFSIMNQLNPENQAYFDQLIYYIRFSLKDEKMVEETLYELVVDIFEAQKRNISAQAHFNATPKQLAKSIMQQMPFYPIFQYLTLMFYALLSISFIYIQPLHKTHVIVDVFPTVVYVLLSPFLLYMIIKIFIFNVLSKKHVSKIVMTISGILLLICIVLLTHFVNLNMKIQFSITQFRTLIFIFCLFFFIFFIIKKEYKFLIPIILIVAIVISSIYSKLPYLIFLLPIISLSIVSTQQNKKD